MPDDMNLFQAQHTYSRVPESPILGRFPEWITFRALRSLSARSLGRLCRAWLGSAVGGVLARA
jgi:hypothetical protein